MDIDKIEVLVRAIELGSLSKAANEFSYTPSAVSHILDNIENEIGIRFIKRTYAGITIEDECKDIVDNLSEIVNIQKRAKQLALKIQQKKKVLTIATYASLSKHIMAKIIKGFNKKVPDIHINIMVINDVKKAFEDDEVDIILGEKIEGEHIC